MGGPFDIVKDSSIWTTQNTVAAHNATNTTLRVGTVKNVFVHDEDGELRYLVDVQHWNDTIPMTCRLLRRFGGVYNYEDYTYHGYVYGDTPDTVTTHSAKAGDVVLVGQLNGQGREGVILGGLMHAARRTGLDIAGGPQYRSEFNGIEKSINSDGEYILTAKGVPTNATQLDSVPSNEIAPPTYDTTVGSSFLKFDKLGGWTVSDNADRAQLIHINKANGTLSVTSGAVSLRLTKASETTELTTKILSIDATDSTTITTKTCSIAASETAALKSPKVAIGKEGVELLDQLAQMIDQLGMCMPISPVGPCTPLKATPQWPQVEAIKSKIKEITGSF